SPTRARPGTRSSSGAFAAATASSCWPRRARAISSARSSAPASRTASTRTAAPSPTSGWAARSSSLALERRAADERGRARAVREREGHAELGGLRAVEGARRGAGLAVGRARRARERVRAGRVREPARDVVAGVGDQDAGRAVGLARARARERDRARAEVGGRRSERADRELLAAQLGRVA